MKTRNLFLIVLCSILFGSSASAQKLLWDIDFDSRFDNREYNTTLAGSQTLFGARLSPQIGVGWGHGNSIQVGGNFLVDFGARAFDRNPELVLYYGYESRKFNVFAGLVPRGRIMGDYSYAIFSDSVRFYDTNIDGLLLQYTGQKGYLEFGCDWNSMMSGDRREKFQIFSAGEVHTTSGLFFGGYNLSIYHHSHSENETGVVDNGLFNPFVGLNLSKRFLLDSLVIQAGWMQGYHRDRRFEGKTRMPGGAQIELRLEKWKVGIDNTLYIGEGQMPFYAQYGNGLYTGSPFYRMASDLYNRLEIYWNPLRRRDMNLKISSVHHYEGKSWSWQQMVTFSVRIDEGMFKRKAQR